MWTGIEEYFHACSSSLKCSWTFPLWGHVWMGGGIDIQGNLYRQFPTSRPSNTSEKRPFWLCCEWKQDHCRHKQANPSATFCWTVPCPIYPSNGMCKKVQEGNVPECSWMYEYWKITTGYPSNLPRTMCERDFSFPCHGLDIGTNHWLVMSTSSAVES